MTANGTPNLIPFKKDDPVTKMIAKQGGKTLSPQKNASAKWREVKKRMYAQGASEKDVAWMIERMENRDAMAVDILNYVEEIKKTIHPSQRVALANTQISAAKFQHGEKIKTENVNINVNASMEEWQRRLKEQVDEEDVQ